jgi:hypothetical protein
VSPLVFIGIGAAALGYFLWKVPAAKTPPITSVQTNPATYGTIVVPPGLSGINQSLLVASNGTFTPTTYTASLWKPS